MANKTGRIMTSPQVGGSKDIVRPVYTQSEQLQWGKDGRDFQPYYVSGGAGEEERDLLHTLGREYNVKLIFAAKEGNYISEVSMTIANGRGQKVLEAVSEGPWFYTKLPPGTYSVVAQVEGRTQQQVTQVNQQKQTQLQFYW